MSLTSFKTKRLIATISIVAVASLCIYLMTVLTDHIDDVFSRDLAHENIWNVTINDENIGKLYSKLYNNSFYLCTYASRAFYLLIILVIVAWIAGIGHEPLNYQIIWSGTGLAYSFVLGLYFIFFFIMPYSDLIYRTYYTNITNWSLEPYEYNGDINCPKLNLVKIYTQTDKVIPNCLCVFNTKYYCSCCGKLQTIVNNDDYIKSRTGDYIGLSWGEMIFFAATLLIISLIKTIEYREYKKYVHAQSDIMMQINEPLNNNDIEQNVEQNVEQNIEQNIEINNGEIELRPVDKNDAVITITEESDEENSEETDEKSRLLMKE